MKTVTHKRRHVSIEFFGEVQRKLALQLHLVKATEKNCMSIFRVKPKKYQFEKRSKHVCFLFVFFKMKKRKGKI